MTETKEAVHRPGRWMGWIWAIPIAAVGIVTWLGVRSLTQGGPEVVVTFAEAGGVKPGDTQVTYNGMQVGAVESVRIHKDLQAVDVRLSLDAEMTGHLGPGTRFWISGVGFNLNDLSFIRGIITGPKIEVDPRPGPTQKHVRGLDQAPVLKHEPAGAHYVLHATHLGTISRGSPIYYRDLQVGDVQGYKFAAPADFDIYAFVEAPYAQLVHVGSRFWDASAAQLSFGAGGPSFRLQSPAALVAGAVAFETPADEAGEVAPPGRDFPLYEGEEQARHAPAPDAVTYRVTLDDAAAAALADGAPVQLQGRRVGSVTDNVLRFQHDGERLVSEVTIAIDPHSLRIADAPGGSGRAPMDAVFARLVQQGLRAELSSSPPVVGDKMIALHFVPGAPTAKLMAGTPPALPTSPGGDIGQIVQQVSDVASKVDALPLPAIAQDIHETTQRLAHVSRSPELRETLENLDRSVANVEAMTAQARGQVGPLLQQLRRTAEQANAAVASAHTVLSGQGGNGLEQAGLPQALNELTRAARSLRELADLLDRHPQALLLGKAQ